MLPYALTIGLGAFLLFLVQPVMGRYLLPWFGGGPSVWNTCMVFFQVALLAGYAYAHLSIQFLRPARQLKLHAVLLALCVLCLPAVPAAVWRPQESTSPATGILLMLLATVGLPYLLLSSTGPLMQAWFARQFPDRVPYRLYSLSNAASMAALLGYPFVLEPQMGLRWQSWVWSGLFVAYVAASVWCALLTSRGHQGAVAGGRPLPDGRGSSEGCGSSEVSASDRAMWFVLAALASAMLLATNNQVGQDLPAVPLVWMLPLAVYLLSFILCFGSPLWYFRPLWLALGGAALVGTVFVTGQWMPAGLFWQVAIYGGILLVYCMICHGELVRIKPPAAGLTGFYLTIAAGGAAGSALVTLVAPAVFRDYWEYQLLVVACVGVVFFQWCRRYGEVTVWRAILGGAVGSALVLGVGFYIVWKNSVVLEGRRSFFGVLQVRPGGVPGTTLAGRHLVHGRIEHGMQLNNPLLRREPVSYYGRTSGVGLAHASLRRQRKTQGGDGSLCIGAVGLGAGVVAAYGRAGDRIWFYEINPDVVDLARKHFTYLSDTQAESRVILGDARLSMARQRRQGQTGKFDLLVLDAFSGDSIPMHLLTREAFDEYWAHMSEGGVIAVHISNRYIDLRPVVLAAAQERGAEALLIEDADGGRPGVNDSRWVLVTMNRRLVAERQIASAAVRLDLQCRPMLFTDDYSNIVRLVELE